MAYTINKTSGAILSTVADGTLDNTTSITLIGKNYPGYGETLNENFVRLLENFSNTSAPSSPLAGQLWWDSTNSLLKVYSGSAFKNIGGSTSAASAPGGPVTGDLWWDTANAQLKVYNGSSWTTIGPANTAGQGTSGAIVETITDSASVAHTCVSLYAANTRVAIVSKDATFTPSPAVSGFTTITTGINLASTGVVSGNQFTGIVSNANLLDSLDSTDFMRATANTATTGTLAVNNNTGLTVGAAGDLKVSVSSSNVTTENQNNGATLIFKTRTSGGIVNTNVIMQNDGSVVPGANVSYNLGSATAVWNNIYGKASSAAYADLAERYEADRTYPKGTVMCIGGENEVTAANWNSDIFGVISSDPAYLMNSTAGTDETHPPIALVGRVPVRVVGACSKGDKLVVGTRGVATKYVPDEATDPVENPTPPLSQDQLVGRALADKYTEEEELLEVVLAAH